MENEPSLSQCIVAILFFGIVGWALIESFAWIFANQPKARSLDELEFQRSIRHNRICQSFFSIALLILFLGAVYYHLFLR